MVAIYISAAVLLAAVGAAIVTARKAFTAAGVLPLDAAWIDDLSVNSYRPMMRLLDERDFEFLRSQPGYTPRMAAKLRTQRRQIFRGYVRRLESDFQRVSMAVKVLMLQAHNDRPDLAATLLRRQMAFAGAIMTVNARVFLYRWGLGAVDVSSLVDAFDALRVELKVLAPSAAGAMA